MKNNSLRPLLLLLIAIALGAAACGDSEAAAIDGVASASDLDETLEDAQPEETVTTSDANGDAPATAGSSGDLSPEEAALALSVCMRDNGFPDFPDPVIGANGAPNLRAAIAESGVDFAAPEFREQIDACRDEVGAENFGAGGRNNEIREQVQERLLGYTQCLRDQGLDVGDLAGPGQGDGQQGQGQGQQGDGAGRARGNVGNVEGRSARIAQALGLDVDDPATAAALEACDSVLVEAFAGVVGPQAQNT